MARQMVAWAGRRSWRLACLFGVFKNGWSSLPQHYLSGTGHNKWRSMPPFPLQFMIQMALKPFRSKKAPVNGHVFPIFRPLFFYLCPRRKKRISKGRKNAAYGPKTRTSQGFRWFLWFCVRSEKINNNFRALKILNPAPKTQVSGVAMAGLEKIKPAARSKLFPGLSDKGFNDSLFASATPNKFPLCANAGNNRTLKENQNGLNY